MIRHVVLLSFVGMVAAIVLTPLVRDLAERRGWLDRPDGLRKLHAKPVPRLGGVAVYFSFALAAMLLFVIEPRGAQTSYSSYLHLLLACGGIMAIGVADDLRGVHPTTKLVAQAIAGVYLYFAGYQISVISVPFRDAPLALNGLALPLTVLWFVGVSNAFNLIDGLDGLAAGLGLFATATVFIAAVLNDRWEIALLSAALAGALLGFLRYNFNPASIFLGDSGALFVGLALAGLAVRGHMKSSTAIAVAAPLLALGVPLLDTAIAIVRRTLRGQRVFEPDLDHIHHRMLRRGLGPRRVVMILYGCAAAFGALSLLTITGRGQVVGLVVIVTCVTTWLGVAQLGYGSNAVTPPRRHGDPHGDTPQYDVAELKARFAEATGLRELWLTLTRAAQELGFIALDLEAAELTRAIAREARLPATFPHWITPDITADPTTRLSVTVPLRRDGEPGGALVLTSPLLAEQDAFARAALLGALAESFAPRWRALLASEIAANATLAPGGDRRPRAVES